MKNLYVKILSQLNGQSALKKSPKHIKIVRVKAHPTEDSSFEALSGNQYQNTRLSQKLAAWEHASRL